MSPNEFPPWPDIRPQPKKKCHRDKRHLAWIRKRPCVVCGRSPSEAAHVRTGTDGGTSLKPSDCWVMPLCYHHHRVVQHRIGEPEFEKQFGIDMKKEAMDFWKQSPHWKDLTDG